jgi:hypothetical protein
MKKILVFILIICFIISTSACDSTKKTKEDKYIMNASYSYGGDSKETIISYEIIISGEEGVVENIDAYEVLINAEYSHLMLENGPHNPEKVIGDKTYFKVTGNFVFDTSGKTKQEIDKMALLKGIRIVDKNEGEEILKFHSN